MPAGECGPCADPLSNLALVSTAEGDPRERRSGGLSLRDGSAFILFNLLCCSDPLRGANSRWELISFSFLMPVCPA